MLDDREQRIMDALYTEQSVPADRLVNDTPALKRFAAKFNSRCDNGTSRRFEQVGQCLIWMRKQKLLSPLGERTLRAIRVALPSKNVIKIIKEIYRENDYPSDRLRNNPRAMKAFTAEVNSRASQSFTPDMLGAILFRLRKDVASLGEFPRLGKSFKGPNL